MRYARSSLAILLGAWITASLSCWLGEQLGSAIIGFVMINVLAVFLLSLTVPLFTPRRIDPRRSR